MIIVEGWGILLKYKLMAVDIDGTLLNSKGQLTEKTKETIRKAVAKGLIFTISTGRAIQGVLGLIDEIGLDLPFITYNGAMIIKGDSREIVYERKLSPKDAKMVYQLGVDRGVTIILWNENKLFVSEINDKSLHYSKMANEVPILIKNIDKVVINGATKVLWYEDAKLLHQYQLELREILDDNVNYHTSRPFFLEFVVKEATKALAIQRLEEIYGIKKEEIIAIGDGFNDLSMIEYAGLGVAMDNAPLEIKKIADFVTLSCDNNGVSYVIEKFVLEENYEASKLG